MDENILTNESRNEEDNESQIDGTPSGNPAHKGINQINQFGGLKKNKQTKSNQKLINASAGHSRNFMPQNNFQTAATIQNRPKTQIIGQRGSS